MEQQVFAPRLPQTGVLNESTFRPIKNSKEAIKPKGGLWTSSYDPAYGSDWLRFALHDTFFYDDDIPGLWLLTPSPDAKIFVIDTAADLVELLAQYPDKKHPLVEMGNPFLLSYFSLIDYEAAAKDWDAIHLTEEGQHRTRFSTPSLYGWDVESTLWLHWKFTGIEPLAWNPKWGK